MALRCALAIFLVVPAGHAARQDPATPPSDVRGSVVVLAARERYFVGEPFTVTVELHFETEFLENALLPLFRRPLDLPVQLRTSWHHLSIATVQPPPPVDPGTRIGSGGSVASLAHGDDEILARRTNEEGRVRFAVDFSLVAERPGTLRLPAPVLRLAYATEFREDFVSGLVPVDRQEARIDGPPFELTIEDWPEAGRPPGFAGAVGDFQATASLEHERIASDSTAVLSLTISGTGNLEAFETPALPRLAGLELRGTLETLEPSGRTFHYDLAPTRTGVIDVPSIPFAYFDPTPPEGYRVAATQPLVLVVTPARTDPEPAAIPVAPPVDTSAENVRDGRGARYAVGALLFAIILFAARRRRYRVSRLDPSLKAAREAFDATLRRAAASDPDAAFAALRAFIDRRGHSAREACERREISIELERRWSEVIEQLEQARFGGPRVDEPRRVATELVDDWMRDATPRRARR